MAIPKRVKTKIARAIQSATIDAVSVEAELAAFIDKFDPALATLIRECRAEVRKLLPTAIELVYDNYNFFVIGYASSERRIALFPSLPLPMALAFRFTTAPALPIR